MVGKIVQEFDRTRFDARTIREAVAEALRLSGAKQLAFSGSVEINGRTYYFDSREGTTSEFFVLYDSRPKIVFGSWQCLTGEGKPVGKVDFRYHRVQNDFSLSSFSIELPHRDEMDRVLDILVAAQSNSPDTSLVASTELEEKANDKAPIVFIGHGRSAAWQSLKNHLTDQHGFQVVAYETGARAGHHIRDILDEMASESSIAFLVMTGEDELVSGAYQARPNVIHETGLFQGKLGFSRAIVLLEEGCSEFSNLSGIQQLRFRDIKETFGDVLATIKREFGR